MRKMQHKTEVVKNVLISIFISLFSVTALAQQTNFLIDLDSIAEEYSVSRFSLSTRDIYGTNDSVYLFNIMPKYIENPRENPEFAKDRIKYLFLFAVFPTLNSDEQWTTYEKFPHNINILSFNQLLADGPSNIELKNEPKMPDRYGILIKKGQKYYKSNISYMQTFYLNNYPSAFNVPANVININQQPISIKDMEKIYETNYKGRDLPIIPNVYPEDFDNMGLERFYLSRKFRIKNMDAYQFWTFKPRYGVSHGESWEQGIDRFIYIPDKGIVGGSFDFYFYYHRQKLGMTTLDFKNNIKQEKVMLAEQYK
ncbi:hypothetical protein ACFU8T_05860 [Sphingobacterium spiritivorum]|uniref:Uncharacterized protein n=1 Tax=Sphingobacterium spiritivorum ATCC 33861 TaxID=525373 RepID=D7VR82_SPHSI|nr:hypothetical protein [Sphingobacterium spiritivorum]EFK56283.1 hypothetical protein HMPREF0766_13486 [Sphingobacterium spiritivorum ATCC 33861]QQT35628.1 hypothetical protein I6J01_20560 [Sphingobacterium spiritivorum]WQD32329.1 hypothetical protein U0038_12505 [Sphingobacterium spiritivorum]SUJ07965.1 Uncharacterised protein [Sphingobacterium spiritivorum]